MIFKKGIFFFDVDLIFRWRQNGLEVEQDIFEREQDILEGEHDILEGKQDI